LAALRRKSLHRVNEGVSREAVAEIKIALNYIGEIFNIDVLINSVAITWRGVNGVVA